jgi:hypothetical protein
MTDEKLKKIQTLLVKDEQLDRSSKEFQNEVIRILTQFDKEIIEEDD